MRISTCLHSMRNRAVVLVRFVHDLGFSWTNEGFVTLHNFASPVLPQDKAAEYAEQVGVEDADKWSIVYGMLCFVIGFRILFYFALVMKHSGARK